MKEEVAQVASQCMVSRGKSRVAQKKTLKFSNLTWKPSSHLEMDLVGEPPLTSHGFRWILVVQDFLTKNASKDALKIAALLVHEVFYRFGIPKCYNQIKIPNSTKKGFRMLLC
jgi:hypothetical protein